MSKNISDKAMSMLSQMSYLEVQSTLEQAIDADLKVDMDCGTLSIREFMEYHEKNNRSEYKKVFGGFTEEEIEDFIRECGNYKIVGDIPYNGTQESGLYGYIIEIESMGDEEKPKGEAIVALRGSENFSTNINDWKNNGSLPYTTQTQQQSDLLEFISNSNLDNYQSLHVTGHSLGGNLALYMTVAGGLEDKIIDCRTFNAPGFSEEFIKMHKTNIDIMSPYIKEFQNEHDIVSSLLHNLTKPYICKNAGVAKFKDYLNFTHHAIHDLTFNTDGSFAYEPDIEKDRLCKKIHLMTILVDKLPQGVSKSIIELVFRYLEGSATSFEWDILSAILLTNRDHMLAIASCLIVVAFLDILMIRINEGLERLEEEIKRILSILWDKVTDLLNKVLNTVLNFAVDLTKMIIDYIEELSNFCKEMIDAMIEACENLFDNVLDFILDFGRDKVTTNYGSLNVDLVMLDYIKTKLEAVDKLADSVQWKLFTLNTNITINPLVAISTNPVSFSKPKVLNRVKKHIELSIEQLEECETYIQRKIKLIN